MSWIWRTTEEAVSRTDRVAQSGEPERSQDLSLESTSGQGDLERKGRQNPHGAVSSPPSSPPWALHWKTPPECHRARAPCDRWSPPGTVERVGGTQDANPEDEAVLLSRDTAEECAGKGWGYRLARKLSSRKITWKPTLSHLMKTTTSTWAWLRPDEALHGRAGSGSPVVSLLDST